MNDNLEQIALRVAEGEFWERVTVLDADSCWEWRKGTHKGYGVWGKGHDIFGTYRTHRISWILNIGPIPDGMSVCHKCDNRKCVNPSHLFIGTNQENTRDRVNKNRSAVGLKNGQTKLTDTQVIEILKDSRPQRKIASQYGVTQALIWQIKSGTIRKNIRSVHGIS